MPKSYKLSGTGNYIDSTGVSYKDSDLESWLNKVLYDFYVQGNKLIFYQLNGEKKERSIYTPSMCGLVYSNASGTTGTVTCSVGMTNWDMILIRCKGPKANNGRIIAVSPKLSQILPLNTASVTSDKTACFGNANLVCTDFALTQAQGSSHLNIQNNTISWTSDGMFTIYQVWVCNF